LEELLLDPSNKPEDLQYKFVPSAYLYELSSTPTWRSAQAQIPVGSSLLALSIYSDECAVDFHTRFKFKPWVITLGNFTISARCAISTKRLLGYMPEPPDPPNQRAAHKFYQWVLQQLFDEINSLSGGFYLVVHGVQHNFVPVLFTAPSDWPEGQRFCCMFSGSAGRANANCRHCFCPNADYKNPDADYVLRTERGMKAKFEKYSHTNQAAAKEKQYSAYLVKVCLSRI
jgi:hypothetical protein